LGAFAKGIGKRPRIKVGCCTIETAAMQFFAFNGWLFTNRILYVAFETCVLALVERLLKLDF